MATLSGTWWGSFLDWLAPKPALVRSKRAYEVGRKISRESGGPNEELKKLYGNYLRHQQKAADTIG